MGKGQSLQQMVQGNLNIHMQKNEVGPFPNSIYKNQLKMDEGPRCYAMLCYAKSLQSCPTLCDPIDGSPPGSPVPGILQARTLEWVAIAFSNA